MSRRRKTYRSLAESRIYAKRLRFYLFSAEPIVNPKTGKATKWHSLCLVAEGEHRARELARDILEHNRQGDQAGNMPRLVREFVAREVAARDATAPKDAPRRRMHDRATAELRRQGEAIAEAFTEFDVADVVPSDVAQFLDQWEGRRMAQVYRSRLLNFFKWTARRGLRADNPVREIGVEKPAKRQTYITDDQFWLIRDALAIGKDRRPTESGPVVQAYVDLCYLLYQRTTEIRLLRWDAITADGIRFKPTKTERASGLSVLVPMSPAVRAVIDRLKGARPIASMYVISTRRGQPYNSGSLRTAWQRACERAGVEGVTLKDLRAKALTDAKKAGYKTEQLKVAAAHTSEEMTEGYIRQRETPVSEVVLSMPKRSNG